MAHKDFIPPQGLLYEAMRRGDLAKKILAGQKLNITEKQEIYFFLTGENPPPSKKRGRPSTRFRDFNLAATYIDEWAKGKRGDTLRKIREDLAKEYVWLNRENSFYAAFKRGRREIRFFYAEVMRRTEEGRISDPQGAKSIAQDLLIKIDDYEKQTEQLQKKGK